MTPQESASLWLQIAMLLHEQLAMQLRLDMQEQRIQALERRIARLEMEANKQRIEFSAN